MEATPAIARLDVNDLQVVYDQTVAVDGVDLQVEAGEVVCLLGPSGCGKSSILRAIAGLEPYRGTVRLDGNVVDGLRPDQRRVGLMFQDHALFPHRDVFGNVAFGPRMLGWEANRIQARVAELLDLLGLDGLGARHVDELSGGQRQRVALARALAPEPRLLMLDEPLGSIDRVLRDQLLDDLPEVFDRAGTTVLYVTHDHDEARALADRVAVMRDGRIVQIGPTADVWRSPADDFVAHFLDVSRQ